MIWCAWPVIGLPLLVDAQVGMHAPKPEHGYLCFHKRLLPCCCNCSPVAFYCCYFGFGWFCIFALYAFAALRSIALLHYMGEFMSQQVFAFALTGYCTCPR